MKLLLATCVISEIRHESGWRNTKMLRPARVYGFEKISVGGAVWLEKARRAAAVAINLTTTLRKQFSSATRDPQKDWVHGPIPRQTNAPKDIYAITAHGVPGQLLEGDDLGMLWSVKNAKRVSCERVIAAILENQKQHPGDPPVAIIVACDSGVKGETSESVASQAAAGSRSWVLGSLGDVDKTKAFVFDPPPNRFTMPTPNPRGKGYVLFDPLGRRVDYDFHNPMTEQDWR